MAVKAAVLVDPLRIHHGSWLAARAAVGLAGRSLLAGWRRQLLSSAVDVTDPSTGRSCVVVATHPGDETLSAGATIARKRAAGTSVHVVVVTDGRHGSPSRYLRPRELAARRALEAEEPAPCWASTPTTSRSSDSRRARWVAAPPSSPGPSPPGWASWGPRRSSCRGRSSSTTTVEPPTPPPIVPWPAWPPPVRSRRWPPTPSTSGSTVRSPGRPAPGWVVGRAWPPTSAACARRGRPSWCAAATTSISSRPPWPPTPAWSPT